MFSLSVLTAVIAGLLVLISLMQPLARRLRLPYTVVLAMAGVALGGLSSVLLYTPETQAVSGIVDPLVHLPFSASVFLVVFLPILLFHAALTLDIRELVEDAAPILTLAIVAVFVAAAGIGFSLNLAGSLPLVVALMVGAIVATTDPAAVVGIFRDLGAPARLLRLVEGESLLNDAAAIVLFTVLLGMLTTGARPDIAASALQVVVAFGGGILLGFVGGRVFGAVVPLLGGSKPAEATLSLALPYLTYLAGEEIFEVSGVVAVVSAGLTAGAVCRARLEPDNWLYLERVWEQLGFWAGSLIFISASLLVPSLLAGFHLVDLWLLGALILAALATRAVVLFALLPLLSALRLSQKVNAAYQLAITWGGLRGAVTLALALAVTENQDIDPATRSLVPVLATGFVLFTLLFNGLTLRPMIRLLKLDRLSPLDQVLRSKVVALACAEVRDAVRATSQEFEIAPAVAHSVTHRIETRFDDDIAALEQTISDRDRITIGLVALTNHEHRVILDHHAQHTVAVAAIERLLRNTRRILEAAKAEGRIGYNRASRRLLAFSPGFRFANLLHRRLGIERPLARQITTRFETLLIRGLALKEMARFNERRLRPLLGGRIADVLAEMLAQRTAATTRALEALRLQYPDYADGLERHFLRQTGLRLELSLFRELLAEGLIGHELYDALEREHVNERGREYQHRRLDLGLNTAELVTRFELFQGLGAAELKALARLFRPRLALPEERIIRKGERGTHVFFISSGAVEVILPGRKVRLGRGDFFGEMALLSGRPRTADVVALGFCQLLVLSAADFRRFLAAHATARAEIDRVVGARTLMNEETARALSATPI
ncbi:MAG TPA: cation:proton antiporter [Stellaceae bacterium]|nr:cation:proton antiporter [Stellaceae bacterium]